MRNARLRSAAIRLGAIALVIGTSVLGLASGAAGTAHALSSATWRNVYDWTGGDGYVGWHSRTTAADDYALKPAVRAKPGLWLWPLGGKKTYETADYAEWTYTAPGTTRIETAHVSYAWNNKLLAHHCIDIG